MANRLADLNRQKRDVAYSGRATIGDVPFLYELQAEQAAANAPAGIGMDGGGSPEATGAPNPQSFGVGGGVGGGGASGGADLGLAGPGLDGLDNQFYDFMQQFERGGQAGEPGGVGDNYSENPYADPSGFGTVGSIGSQLTGIPGLGLVGAGIGAAYDLSLANQFDPNYDSSLGSFLSSFGNIATGGLVGSSQLSEALDNYRDVTGTGLNDAALAAAVTGGNYSGPKGAGGVVDSSMGGLNEAARGAYEGGAGSYSGPKGVNTSGSGNKESGGSAYGGGGGGGGGAEGGSRAGGQSGANVGGERSDRGTNTYHSGGYVSEQNIPGELRGDVSATLQEGEGVLTADALDVLGPGFVYGVNMMAKMMRGRSST